MPLTKSNPKTVTLRIVDGSGREREIDVTNDSSMLVGSDRNCGIRLVGTGIAAKHCMLRYSEGALSVRDWFSETGTHVNGQRIAGEAILGSSDQVRVGDNYIALQPSGSTSASAAQSAAPATETLEQPPPPRSPERKDEAMHSAVFLDGSQHEIEQLRLQLHDSRQLNAQLQAQLDQLTDSSPPQSALGWEQRYNDVPLDRQEVELLRIEIEQLQVELADRDQQLHELASCVDPDSPCSESVDPGETAALVERFEQLLDELKSSDDRIATLEALLRASDEANQAEREERRQLETWVDEIEHRIGQREAEWQAERDRLLQRTEEAARDRDRAEALLRRRGTSAPGHLPQAAEAECPDMDLVAELRQQADQLREQLAQGEARYRQLESRLQSSGWAESDVQSQCALQQQLREHELELSRERADVARQQAEVGRMREELQRQADRMTGQRDQSGERLQALRQHLEEIHQQEQMERKERTLSARIKRLWQRLDG